ncbi:MAG: hypothetical protein ACREC4_00415 [Methylocella sp.]
MHRTIVYADQIPLDIDFLRTQRNAMVGIGEIARSSIGQNVAVSGMACIPNSPPTLVLNIQPGSIYQVAVIDQTSYGSLDAVLTQTTMLQGLLLDQFPLTFIAPASVGQAVAYLIEVGLSVDDTTPIVLPYYNASNPAVPWLGPNNNSTSQATQRLTSAIVRAKTGVAATTGTQVPPAADPGFYPLYIVTIANGQTGLTSNDFIVAPDNVFLPTNLEAIPSDIQTEKWTYAVDSGTANALVAALSKAPASLVAGLRFSLKKTAAANTGPSTLDLNGSGVRAITLLNGNALLGGEMPGSAIVDFAYDGTNYQLLSPTQQRSSIIHTGTDLGSPNAIIATLTPAVAGYEIGALYNITIGASNGNTAAATANLGFGAVPVVRPNLGPTIGGEYAGLSQVLLSYTSGGAMQMVGGGTATQFRILPAPRTYYVNASTGNDANDGLTAGTAFATVSKAALISGTFNLNGFILSIIVADGAYAQAYFGPTNGSGNIEVIGNSATPANCVITNSGGSAIIVASGGMVNFTGFTFVSTGSSAVDGGAGIWASGSATVNITNCRFGACKGAYIASSFGGFVTINGAFNIAGSLDGSASIWPGAAVFALSGTIRTNPATPPALTISSPVTGSYFAYASSPSTENLHFASITNPGNFTGQKYLVTLNAIINTTTGDVNYLPGTIAGVDNNGGKYV